MRVFLRVFLCMYCLVYLCGCGSRNVPQETSDKVVKVNKVSKVSKVTMESYQSKPFEVTMKSYQAKPFDMDDYFSEIQIVPLETNKKCLMDRIRQIEIVDSLMLISDEMRNLYLFDLGGRFIRQIGRRGKGPGEYNSFNAFYINRSTKTIIIVDHSKLLLLTYRFDGSFISSKGIPDSRISWEQYAQLSGDGNVLFFNTMNPEHSRAYTLLNPSKMDTLQPNFSYDPVKLSGYSFDFAIHPMSISEGNIYFTMPLDRTIYEYSDGKFSSKYNIEIPLEMLPTERLATALSGSRKIYSNELMNLAGDKYFAGFTDIFETEKFIWLKYKHKGILPGFYLLDKDKNEGNYYQYSSNLSDILQHPFMDIRTSFANGLVGVLTNTYSIGYLKDLIKNPEESNVKVEEVNPAVRVALNAATEDDNPILIFYFTSVHKKVKYN